jgi:hypothetical protein
MSTLLDRPLFKLKPDAGPRQYANVPNALEVARGHRTHTRHVQVSASLFHLMRHLDVPVTASVSLYLDHDAGLWYFGLMVNDRDIIDLWSYPDHEIPPFIL